MASTDRRSARDLIAEIKRNGPRFRFFQAVRLLALAAADRNDDAPAAVPRKLRFGTPLSLSFPASEITDVQTRPDQQEAEADRFALLVTIGFMGLTGPSGTLPTAYTEMLIERRNFHRDTSAHRFLDFFSHRIISLFYQAWRKHRFYLAYEAGDRDNFTRNLLDIVGVGLTPLQSRLKKEAGGVPDIFLTHFAGLLAQKPMSAMNLAALLRGYFKVDASVEQFVGQWIALPDTEQSRLGMQSCALGESAFAGERLWDRQTKIRIRLGPLTDTEFADFLPGQPGAVAITELVQFCVGHSLACDVALSLDKRCVPAPQLNDGQLRLGYNTWLHSRPIHTHPDDAHYGLLS